LGRHAGFAMGSATPCMRWRLQMVRCPARHRPRDGVRPTWRVLVRTRAMKHAPAIRPKVQTAFDLRGSTNRLLPEPQRPDAHCCSRVQARVPVP